MFLIKLINRFDWNGKTYFTHIYSNILRILFIYQLNTCHWCNFEYWAALFQPSFKNSKNTLFAEHFSATASSFSIFSEDRHKNAHATDRTPSVLKFRWTNKSINNRKSNSNIYLCYKNRVISILKTPLTIVNWAFQGTP